MVLLKEGTKIKIILKSNNYFYSGIVIEDKENSISFIDKFNNQVTISKDSISIIETLGDLSFNSPNFSFNGGLK